MSVLGAILGKRTWLGAGAILLSAAGGCALGALLVVKRDPRAPIRKPARRK